MHEDVVTEELDILFISVQQIFQLRLGRPTSKEPKSAPNHVIYYVGFEVTKSGKTVFSG